MCHEELSAAPAVSLITDGWTSRATEGYLTAMAHYITPWWEMERPVLQTWPVNEQYTACIWQVVSEWIIYCIFENIRVSSLTMEYN